NAIGSLNQSYAYSGFLGSGGKTKSGYTGSSFTDATDDCDLNTTCDLVGGLRSATPESGASPK
ncbi:MAG: hypothetical protein CME32_05560, partial [Gimesia sp.]|nr:hypothetical protein [Gimesia sp.]